MNRVQRHRCRIRFCEMTRAGVERFVGPISLQQYDSLLQYDSTMMCPQRLDYRSLDRHQGIPADCCWLLENVSLRDEILKVILFVRIGLYSASDIFLR